MWTVFPIPLGEAASWEPKLAHQTARATAHETTASGIHWTFVGETQGAKRHEGRGKPTGCWGLLLVGGCCLDGCFFLEYE